MGAPGVKGVRRDGHQDGVSGRESRDTDACLCLLLCLSVPLIVLYLPLSLFVCLFSSVSVCLSHPMLLHWLSPHPAYILPPRICLCLFFICGVSLCLCPFVVVKGLRRQRFKVLSAVHSPRWTDVCSLLANCPHAVRSRPRQHLDALQRESSTSREYPR